jgi:hypothetical protein
MIGRSRHLSEDCLFDGYLAAREGQPLDPPAAEHLADCEECSARYAELAGFLNQVRAEGDAEADDIFTTDQLNRQYEQILHRIEHLNRSARVISFPGRIGHQIGTAAGRVAPRWLAAAAAAGLFVGVAVGGTFLQPGVGRRLPRMRVATESSAAARIIPAPVIRVNNPTTADPFDDEAFLMELEFALQRPHTRELQPFDALTPHVQEIGTVNR